MVAIAGNLTIYGRIQATGLLYWNGFNTSLKGYVFLEVPLKTHALKICGIKPLVGDSLLEHFQQQLCKSSPHEPIPLSSFILIVAQTDF